MSACRCGFEVLLSFLLPSPHLLIGRCEPSGQGFISSIRQQAAAQSGAQPRLCIKHVCSLPSGKSITHSQALPGFAPNYPHLCNISQHGIEIPGFQMSSFSTGLLMLLAFICFEYVPS